MNAMGVTQEGEHGASAEIFETYSFWWGKYMSNQFIRMSAYGNFVLIMKSGTSPAESHHIPRRIY